MNSLLQNLNVEETPKPRKGNTSITEATRTLLTLGADLAQRVVVIAVARAKCNAALCGALPLPPSLTAVRAELPYTNIYSAGARRQFWRIWMSSIDQKDFVISAKFT